MMNFIKPTIPAYKGSAPQPATCGGLLSQLLGYVFGGGTPAYKGTGQPVSKQGGVPGFSGTPTYQTPTKVATVSTASLELDDSDGDGDDDCDESGLSGSHNASTPTHTMGPITIVVG